ncbi:MAG TPA: hypothetical protein VM076_04870 [Gemmatimonadaceae bacterium]|nr:hypothetical protein [Gemmatimonadaceae bacterium]
MPTLRTLSIAAAALLLSATTVFAQRCLGLPMAGKNYVGAEQRESWTGHRRQTPVYGGRYAHSFDAGKGVGVIASIGGGGGGMKGDTSAVHVSGMLSTSLQPSGSNLSLCAGAGFEAQAVDYPGESRKDADAFGSIPVSLGLGYDVRLGALTVTPFAAPTLAYYQFESDNYKDGDRQKGFDTYVTMGATAAFNRFSVGATYRNGDRSVGQSGRFAFSTGVNF